MPTLREEIKQTIPFSSPAHEGHLAIVRTAAVLGRATAEALKPYDITPTQFNALRILRGAGEQGLCRNEVRARMVALVPDVTRLLDRLEEVGLVERKRSTTDRRFVHTQISPKGNELLGRATSAVDQVHEEYLGHLNGSELRTLNELLARIRDSAP